jgi:hypothetical protein
MTRKLDTRGLVSAQDIQSGEAKRFAWHADAGEREAIRERVGVPALFDFNAEFTLSRRDRDHIDLSGRLKAAFKQVCVVSLEEFEVAIDEAFALLYTTLPPITQHPAATEEAMLAGDISSGADDAPESIGPEGIDLKEAAVQAFSLAIDPYPRAPGADFEGWNETPDEGPSPLADLAKFRREE